MNEVKQLYYEKRAKVLLKNLEKRHFEAYFCPDRAAALQKALELIPEGALVGWGGAMTATQIGLMDALRTGNYRVIDRDRTGSPEERRAAMRACFDADYFLMGANALSLDGQMVTVDCFGNRAGMLVYGPGHVLVVAGMNKVMDTLEEAVRRARTVAAPANQQRFQGKTPCTVSGACGDCHGDDCICSQVVITRNCRPTGRIQLILIGEDDLGL